MVLDGVPAGILLDWEQLMAFMARRAPGQKGATARKESDQPELLSGILDGKTTGAPLAALIRNVDTRSGDYSQFARLARPGHADFTGFARYSGHNDPRGGGHFSGRLTAPLCFAGAVAAQVLAQKEIIIGAHLARAGKISDIPFDALSLDAATLTHAGKQSFPTLDAAAGEQMLAAFEQARSACDSIGGVVECGALGVPTGIGSPMFDGLENRIASLAFGIPGVKGIEFGAGFAAAELFGSENNDDFFIDGGEIRTRTNHAGGILGGITTGMPLVWRAAFKPTPSIAKQQQTVDFIARTPEALKIHGRHDPCIAARAVPVVEAVCAVALLDVYLEAFGFRAFL